MGVNSSDFLLLDCDISRTHLCEMKVSMQKHIGRERPKGNDCEMGGYPLGARAIKQNKSPIHRINRNCNNQVILCAVS